MGKEDTEQCLTRTKEIRTDFAPFVAVAVDKAWSRNMIRVNNDKLKRWHLIKTHLCDFSNGFGLKSLSYGIAAAYTKSNDSTELRADLVKAIADNFRFPRDELRDKMVRVVQKHNPEFKYVKRIERENCYDLFSAANFSDVAVSFASAALHASGMDDDKVPIRLGSLLTRPGLNQLLTFESEIAATSDTYGKLAKSYSHIAGGLNTKDVYKIFVNSFLEMPYVPNSAADLNYGCNMDDELWMLSLFTFADETVQFCTTDNSSACCQYEKEISKDYASVLRLLKYCIAPASRNIWRNKTIAELNSSIEFLGYQHDAKLAENEDPIILACKYDGGGLKQDCNLFANMYTTAGIGYTFNNAPFWNLYRNTSENYAFYKEMYQDLEDGFPRNILSNGKGYSLEFMVNHGKVSYDNKPKMSFHDPHSIADVRNEAYDLEPGMIYDMYVTPSVTVTNDRGLMLDPTQRHCLAHHESEPLNIFKSYSQSTCFFECQLKMASQFCNCTPWNYPRSSGDVLCIGEVAKYCFEKQMEITISPAICDCPNNCNSVQYTVSSMVKPLPLKFICQGSGSSAIEQFVTK